MNDNIVGFRASNSVASIILGIFYLELVEILSTKCGDRNISISTNFSGLWNLSQGWLIYTIKQPRSQQTIWTIISLDSGHCTRSFISFWAFSILNWWRYWVHSVVTGIFQSRLISVDFEIYHRYDLYIRLNNQGVNKLNER